MTFQPPAILSPTCILNGHSVHVEEAKAHIARISGEVAVQVQVVVTKRGDDISALVARGPYTTPYSLLYQSIHQNYGSHCTFDYLGCFKNSGSFAIFAAMRRASSRVSNLAAAARPDLHLAARRRGTADRPNS